MARRPNVGILRGLWLLGVLIGILARTGSAATPPVITVQPQSQAVAAGSGVLLTVEATGEGPVTFEWWNDFGPLYPPQTGAALALASIQLSDAGGYKVQVRNAAGTVTSSVAALVVNSSATENFLFARKGIGSGADPGGNVDIDSAGNIYVAGSFKGSASFGAFTLTSAGGSDVFVVKIDPAGSVAWARRAGGAGADTAAGVAVDRMGNIHVTGAFSGSASFGATTVNASGTSDAFVATFDRDGNALWARKVGGTGATKGWRVACDAAGNSVVLGYFTGSTTLGRTTVTSSGGSDVFVAKFSAGGVPLWLERFGGTGAEQGTGLALDPDASVFVTGSFQGTAAFGDVSLTSSGGTQSFLVKCDRQGVAQWARKISGIDSAAGTTVIAEDDGTCNLTGTFSGTAAFGATTLANREAGERFVAKYDAAGGVLWAARSDAAGSQVGLQPADAAVTSGFGSGALDWSGGAGGGVDLFVAKYSEPGVAVWARQAGASLATFTLGLMADADGQRYVTGFFEDEDGANSGGGYSLARIPLARAAGPPPPLITLMPQDRSVVAGDSVALAVTAAGSSPLSYQWRFNGVDLAGANAATLLLNNVQPANAGAYSVQVFNADGAALSVAAQVAVQAPPDITPPTVAITSPAPGARLTSATVTLQGTAGDPGGLERVEVQVGDGAVQSATGTTSWSALVTLAQGTNTVRVRSVDTAGNASAWVSRDLVFTPIIIVPPITTNAQVLARATYAGLFREDGVFRHESSGFFSLAMTPGGRFTASLTAGGRRYALSGRFNPAGGTTNHIVRAGTSVLSVTLELVSTDGIDEVRGTVAGPGWTAGLRGGRSAEGSPANPVPWAGRYTLVLPGDDNGPAPLGDGYGVVTVDIRGRLSVAATLSDGTRLAQAVPLTTRGLWPLYGNLYATKGVAMGWVAFADRPTDDFAGDLNWSCPSQPRRRMFPDGFTAAPVIIGSRYARPPGSTNRVVALETANVQFEGGNLLAPFGNTVLLTANNRVVNLSSNRLTLAISLPTGLFSGGAVNPASRRLVPFRGALLQKQNAGWGQFNGTNQTGRVTFGP